MQKFLLFIPAYNCEKQIIRVLNQIDNSILEFVNEIIVVNNRSTDNTENAVIEYTKSNNLPLILLKNEENYNLGGSHKVAFDYAIKGDFDYIIILHGDDQGNIKDILPIIQSKEYLNYDCCLGARFLKNSQLIGYSKFRTFGNKVYNKLFSFVVKRKIYDLGSGLNMYNCNMLKSKYYIKFPDRLTFNYCMVLALDYYKQKEMFFSISWREDDQVSNVKLTNQAMNVLSMLRKYFFNKDYIKQEFRSAPKEQYNAQIIYKNEVNACEKS